MIGDIKLLLATRGTLPQESDMSTCSDDYAENTPSHAFFLTFVRMACAAFATLGTGTLPCGIIEYLGSKRK
jgi:hypothetical protein